MTTIVGDFWSLVPSTSHAPLLRIAITSASLNAGICCVSCNTRLTVFTGGSGAAFSSTTENSCCTNRRILVHQLAFRTSSPRITQSLRESATASSVYDGLSQKLTPLSVSPCTPIGLPSTPTSPRPVREVREVTGLLHELIPQGFPQETHVGLVPVAPPLSRPGLGKPCPPASSDQQLNLTLRLRPAMPSRLGISL